MLFPADHVLAAALRELAQLQSTASSAAEGGVLQALGLSLGLLAQREKGGSVAIHTQLDKLSACLSSIEDRLSVDTPHAKSLSRLRERIAPVHAELVIDRAEAAMRAILADVHELATAIAGSPALDTATRAAIADEFVAWECADLGGQIGSSAAGPALPSTAITRESWRDYLRDRFDEPGLEVTAFSTLAGGFGKQTFLFEVEGSKLAGAYVLRRDLAVTLFDNDCHRIEKEYELIRAVFAKGFPAPDAVWLDTQHRMLPGGHFLVMKRSPGKAGGSVFAAKGAVPHDLTLTLAGILARLHNLPPLAGLGPLTDSITPELWDLPVNEVVRRYISNWRDLFEREEHMPSPAITSLFGWLLANLPRSGGNPALLHGDIGFHNFLFDDGQLTAVLDWEFAHVGDPAEDLAYVRNTLGGSLDWDEFLAAYRAAGGPEVTPQRLRFFQVWGHVRNACAANMVSAKFLSRQVDDLKLVLLPHLYIPQFLQAAHSLTHAEA